MSEQYCISLPLPGYDYSFPYTIQREGHEFVVVPAFDFEGEETGFVIGHLWMDYLRKEDAQDNPPDGSEPIPDRLIVVQGLLQQLVRPDCHRPQTAHSPPSASAPVVLPACGPAGATPAPPRSGSG